MGQNVYFENEDASPDEIAKGEAAVSKITLLLAEVDEKLKAIHDTAKDIDGLTVVWGAPDNIEYEIVDGDWYASDQRW